MLVIANEKNLQKIAELNQEKKDHLLKIESIERENKHLKKHSHDKNDSETDEKQLKDIKNVRKKHRKLEKETSKSDDHLIQKDKNVLSDDIKSPEKTVD